MQTPDSPQFSTPQVGNRYVLGTLLGKGGMGEIWKAHDRFTGQDVALKRIRPVRLLVGSAVGGQVQGLTQEFRLLAGLHHPQVISVLDYGFDRQGWPFFTMRLLDNCVTLLAAAEKCDRAGKIRLLIQLFEGLAYVHRRGVLHRDLKPNNILVVGMDLYIVDFGLSIMVDDLGPIDGLAGTVSYLAPELLTGGLPSEQSDLYAAGVLVYEVLTNTFIGSPKEHHGNYRAQVPDFSHPQLSDGLDRLLKQLLVKNPLQRPLDHRAIIAQLGALIGTPEEFSNSVFSDGLSHATSVVGRQSEILELVQDLDAAIDGSGRARMVLGKVGSGKSRLVEELRSRAMIRGAMVLAGRCQAEMGLLFGPWLQVFRLLTIEHGLSDEDAISLKSLLPDIEILLGRKIDSSGHLDQSGIIERCAPLLLRLLSGCDRGVLIIIEDLHWAGQESLDLFSIVTSSVSNLPVLLVGTTRSDETPHLPERLGVEGVTELPPLNIQAIEDLVVETLGVSGSSRALVELIHRESEGVPFFVVEVLRTLIDRAGGWDKVEITPLPERIIIGGMRAVVARRMHRLPQEDRHLAESAAVAGRDLHLSLLLTIEPDADWKAFLLRSIACGLIEGRGGSWFFVHDQIRQTLLENIELDRRRLLHRRIAEALIAHEKNLSCVTLAHHWRMAEVPEEESIWSVRAGYEAMLAGAYHRASILFERTLDLQRRFFKKMSSEIDFLQVRFMAGDAAFRIGDFSLALSNLQGVLQEADRPMAVSSQGRICDLGIQLLIQTAHRLSGSAKAWLGSSDKHERQFLVARSWELLARLHIYSGDGLAVFLCALRATNQSEKIAKPLVFAHGILGCAAASANYWPLAQGYFKRSQSYAELARDAVGLVDSLVMQSSAFLSSANLEQALECLKNARLKACHIGYLLGQGQALTMEGVCHGYVGDLLRMLEVNNEALRVIRHHSPGHQAGFRCGQAKAFMLLGRFSEARATLDQARKTAVTGDRLVGSLVSATFLVVHMREGDIIAAHREALVLHEQIEHVTAVPSPCAVLLEAPAEWLIMRWYTAIHTGMEVEGYAREAVALEKKLRLWTKRNPLESPFLWWFRGHHRFLSGARANAWTAWETGHREAVRFGFPLYESMLSLALAKHGPQAKQQGHRTRARALALASQAMWHVRQVENSALEEESGSAYSYASYKL